MFVQRSVHWVFVDGEVGWTAGLTAVAFHAESVSKPVVLRMCRLNAAAY